MLPGLAAVRFQYTVFLLQEQVEGKSIIIIFELQSCCD